MTRINTNVSSLVAQNRLASSNESLNTSLTRLSTGLRINSGSDDPAGLIASEALRSEVTGITKAISNTQRASQIIGTADSALGQVSNLLNDVRGLVVEASNSGALSDEEVAANQLQIDSSLEAINRIAQTTTFQGRKLLDGSQDFVSTAGSVDSLADVSINQGQPGRLGPDRRRSRHHRRRPASRVTTGAGAFSPAANATATTGAGINEATIGTGANGSVDIQGQYDSVEILAGGTGDTLGATLTDGKLTIQLDETATNNTASDIADAVNGVSGLYAEASGTGADQVAAAAEADATAIEGAGIQVTADEAGADFNNVQINYVAGTGAGTTASYDAEQKAINVSIGTGAGENSLDTISTAIDGIDGFSSDVVGADGAALTGAAAEGDQTTEYGEFTLDTSNLPEGVSTGTTGGEVTTAAVVFQLSGTSGAETFNFAAGTSADHIASAVNLVSDSTGVTASTGRWPIVQLFRLRLRRTGRRRRDQRGRRRRIQRQHQRKPIQRSRRGRVDQRRAGDR